MNSKKPSTAEASEQGVLAFYFEMTALKKLFRSGWLLRGVSREDCESVAEHVFATALLALLLSEDSPQALDRLRVLELALVHELGEIDAGDLTPADEVSSAAKHELESKGVQRVACLLSSRDRILDLWHEYEAGETPEARFVRQIDKLEMAFQAAAYERTFPLDLSEFKTSAREQIQDSNLIHLLDRLSAGTD